MNQSGHAANIRTAPASHGIDWLVDSFAIFSKYWLAWLVIDVIIIVLKIATFFIPFIGGVVMQILMPVLMGGLMLGCRAQDRGEPFLIEHFFSGFSNRFLQLATVGVIQLSGIFLILIFCGLMLFLVIGGVDTVMGIYQAAQNAILAQDMNRLIEVTSGMSLIILAVALTGLALYVPLLVLVWFAPALIILDNQDVITAMKNSFIGCMKNVIPYLLYGIIGLVFSIVASIPLGLGWLVLIPMMIISIYLAYKDIFPQTAD